VSVPFLNEDAERGQRVVLGHLQSAFYLRVDDGIVMGSSSAGQYGANQLMGTSPTVESRPGSL